MKQPKKEEREQKKKKMERRCAGMMMLVLLQFCFLSSATTSIRTKTKTKTTSPVFPVSAMFSLGDSSVLCHNNKFFSTRHHFKTPPCYGSRSVPHLLASNLGLPMIPLFDRENGTIEGLVNGLNFGSSHATIMSTREKSYAGVNLNKQLRQVSETLQLLQLELGQKKAKDLIASSLFFISLGKDDYIQLFLPKSSTVRRNYDSRAFARLLVQQMINSVKELYNSNARRIICMGIEPLGCTPRAFWESSISGVGVNVSQGSCINEINEIISEYNALLSKELQDLNHKLADAHIIFLDVYQGMMEIIANPRHFGFSPTRRACCGSGPYGAKVGCIAKKLACVKPFTSIWWDMYNPTQSVNSLIANWAWLGEPLNISHPINIKNLLTPKP